MKFRTACTVALLLAALPARAEDARQLVKLPAPMQEHMLANMRDHLASLNDLLAALAAGDVQKAGDIAENRIGMSSLGAHGSDHLAQFMPAPMREMGMNLHHAASRLAVAAADAEVENTPAAQRKVYGALHDITDACNACHTAYRVR
ncbi:MAG: hypothetical protein ACM31L_20520 [Actinomycetota bacterium]